MRKISDKEIALANVYADAMLTLAESQGAADPLLEELRDLAGLLDKDAELETFFSSPMIDSAVRGRSLEKVFRGRASDLFVDAIQVLNRKGRLGMFRAIAEAYRNAHETLRGRVEVHVTTAVPLSETLRASLVNTARAHTGKEPTLIEKVDQSLIGGLVVRIGDTKLDMSVARRIDRLGQMLSERASQEVHGERSYVT